MMPAVAAEREPMVGVVDDLSEGADDEYGVGLVTMLRGEDFQDALVDESALPGADPDRLAGPFAHIVVDEARERTDAEWRMLLLPCPSRSFPTARGARPGASPSSGTALRPGTASRSPGRNGSSASGSTRSTWQPSASITGRRRRSWQRPNQSSAPCSRMPTCRPPSAPAASPSYTDLP